MKPLSGVLVAVILAAPPIAQAQQHPRPRNSGSGHACLVAYDRSPVQRQYGGEKRYREWYQIRYHRPQDDLTQPMDFAAAAKFNTFFYDLVEAIGNAHMRPAIYPSSSFAATH
jgi:hypothetical protein